MSGKLSPLTIEVGLALKELRHAIGLKQEDLAAQINMSRSYIAQIETGRLDLTTDRFGEIVAVLLRHFGEIPPIRVDVTLIWALRRLKYSVSEEFVESVEELAEHNRLIVYVETLRILHRLTDMLTGDQVMNTGAVLTPLVGLLLLFPDLETNLLLVLIGSDRAVTGQQYDHMVNHYLVFALYLANEALELTSGRQNEIVAIVHEVFSQHEQAVDMAQSLRKLRKVIEGGVLAPFIDLLLARNQ